MDIEFQDSLAAPAPAPPEARWWSYKLPALMEHRFAHETDAERNRQIRFWISVWFAFSWITAIIDILFVPGIWQLGVILRIFIVTPVGLGGMWLLSAPRRPWLVTLASISLPSVSLMILMFLFANSENYDGFRSALMLNLGIIWANMLIPMRFRDTLIFTSVTLASCEIINFAADAHHHDPIHHFDIIATGLVMIILSIIARFAAERQSRNSFIAGLNLQTHNEQLVRSNASLVLMSNTDPLTGLANRRYFDDAMAQAWQTASTTNSWIAVMMIDVDRFKLFNDAAGHLEGDRCLTIIARAIRDHVRGEFDLAARFGGEEFIVLMPSTKHAKAREVAERVHTAIGALQVFHPGRIGDGFVSVSIGFAAMHLTCPDDQPAVLLAAADRALYAAKTAGRNCVVQA